MPEQSTSQESQRGNGQETVTSQTTNTEKTWLEALGNAEKAAGIQEPLAQKLKEQQLARLIHATSEIQQITSTAMAVMSLDDKGESDNSMITRNTGETHLNPSPSNSPERAEFSGTAAEAGKPETSENTSPEEAAIKKAQQMIGEAFDYATQMHDHVTRRQQTVPELQTVIEERLEVETDLMGEGVLGAAQEAFLENVEGSDCPAKERRILQMTQDSAMRTGQRRV